MSSSCFGVDFSTGGGGVGIVGTDGSSITEPRVLEATTGDWEGLDDEFAEDEGWDAEEFADVCLD